ncbi:MAG TPA: Mov34/MPN/PAD-1 family protein, partial [Chloroflexia bacterium]
MNDEINIENLEFIERPREGLPFTNVVIILDEPALTAMYSHLQTNLEQESGGLLLGRLSQFDGVLFIEITDILPADHAAATMFQLTFDSNTWAKLDEQKRKLFPDRDTVGWYHSHLGIGAFFSPLDHAFHSAVFIEPWFVGVVIDPIANEQAVYSWQGSEMVESAYYMRRTTARSPSSHRVYNADGKVSALLALVRSSGHSPALIGLLADWERTLSSRGSDEHYFDGDSVHLLRLIVLLTKANRAVRKQAQQLLDRMEHEWLLDLEIMQVIATRMPSTSPVLLAWADADIVALIDSTTLLQAAVDGISKPRHWRLPYEVV